MIAACAAHAAHQPGSPLGLATDALVLTRPEAPRALARRGLTHLRVALHAARADAHDWLVDQRGAWRTAVRAVEVARAEGLEVELEAVVTRSTTPHLVELVALAARLGASAVHLTRFAAPSLAAALSLSPRFALAEPELEAARALGADHAVDVRVHGFPRCAVGAAGHALVAPDAVRWLVPDTPAWRAAAVTLVAPAVAGRCAGCRGPSACAGAPADYVAAFGWGELHSEDPDGPGVTEPRTSDPADPRRPAARGGRVPFTRLRAARAAATGPLRERPAPRPEVVEVRFADAAGRPLATRAARRRLVGAAQHGARVLRVVGPAALAHPEATALLRDATRLDGVARVEVASDGAPLATLRPRDLYHLRHIARLDLPLRAPSPAAHDALVGRQGAFDAALTGLARAARVAHVEVAVYGVLASPADLDAWARAWRAGVLPGAPAFRLAADPDGGDLGALVAAAHALDGDDPARRAVLALVCASAGGAPAPTAATPRAAVAVQAERLVWDALALDDDRLGDFDPCPCADATCPGVARGWSPTLARAADASRATAPAPPRWRDASPDAPRGAP